VHFPLPQHRFARPAARAAECAHDQGLFDKFQDLVYSKQDSLGLKSWISYAEEARVPELRRFERCVADTARVARIEAGILLDKQLAVRGTPTVILNGSRFWNPPSQTELLQAIAALKDGKQLSSSAQ
jgi:protein-disulfide isomerase